MNHSAVKNAAKLGRHGRVCFAVESGSLATSESINEILLMFSSGLERPNVFEFPLRSRIVRIVG